MRSIAERCRTQRRVSIRSASSSPSTFCSEHSPSSSGVPGAIGDDRAVCNDYGNRVSHDRYVEAFSHLKLPLFVEGNGPDLTPGDDIRIRATGSVILREGVLQPLPAGSLSVARGTLD